MRHGREWAAFLMGCVLLRALAASANDAVVAGPLARQDDEFYERLALDPASARHQQLLHHLMVAPEGRGKGRKKSSSLDLTPMAETAIRGMGMSIVEDRDQKGRRRIALSAQFSVAEDMPDVKMHLGDRPLEPMGAFYPAKKGFRFAVVYPLRDFSLRVEGGEDSEFGSIAVTGVSWVHPSKRFAAGFGLHGGDLDNVDSNFGAIFQFRMNLR